MVLLEPQEEYLSDPHFFVSLQALYGQVMDHLVALAASEEDMIILLLKEGLVASINRLEKRSQIVLKQSLWRDQGAFQKVLSLLRDSGAPQESVLVAVLDVLASLLAENAESKIMFETTVGYEQLQQIILLACRGRPNFAQLKASLFGLIVDGRYDSTTRVLIKNAPAVTMLVRLLPHLSAADQAALLADFEGLLQSSTTNKALAVQHGVLSELLGFIPAAGSASATPYSLDAIRGGITEGPAEAKILPWTLRCIEVLARHSLGVRDLKQLLRTVLRAAYGADRTTTLVPVPALTPAVLSVIEAVASQRILVGPSSAFDFDGLASAISIPVRSLTPALSSPQTGL